MNITYRKKPVVIEAMKWDGTVESTRAIIEWSDDAVWNANQTDILQIETLEGIMRADVGDFIIKGVKGVRFRFRALATNTDNGSVWVDCFELYKGMAGRMRAFPIDRVVRIPTRRSKQHG